MIVSALVLSVRGAAAVATVLLFAGGVPRVVQATLAVAFGVWSGALVAATGATATLAAVPGELAIGAGLGVVAAVPLVAAAAAGRLVDLAGAGGRATDGPYAALFGLLAAAVFVGVDGHVAVVGAVLDSHRAVPAIGDARAGAVAAIAAIVPIAIRLAMPWLVTAAVVAVATGVGARVAARSGGHVPVAIAAPAALAMMTASLVATLAVAVAQLVRG